MAEVTHEKQRKIWEDEHRKPNILVQMDGEKPSSGVAKFYDWLREHVPDTRKLRGIEMCCGKGRNVIWLAKQDAETTGVDFSEAAITEAKRRAKQASVGNQAHFFVHDVSLPYPLTKASLDFAIDCFGSTDIETTASRKAAAENLSELLKPGGYFATYLLSADDEYHRTMAAKHASAEPGSFVHPVNGKFEKAFTEREVAQLHDDLQLVTLARLPKRFNYGGKLYAANYIWAVFQKPVQ